MLMKTSLPTLAFTGFAILFLSACDGNSPSRGPDVVVEGDSIALGVPAQLLAVRAIDRTQLRAEVSFNGNPVEGEIEGDTWTGAFNIPPDPPFSIQITWIENFMGDLALATLTTAPQTVNRNGTISIDQNDYSTEVLDADSDGFSNLVERNAGSDPRNPNEVPNSSADNQRDPGMLINANQGDNENLAVDLRIARIEANQAPAIDGLYDDIWNSAFFVDNNGDTLRIDNLMVDQGADRADNDTEFQWFALHDDTNLYLFVLGEESGMQTHFRDSVRAFHDDNLNLHFDGNNSKGAGYDGVDDMHILIPLIDSGDSLARTERGPNSIPIPSDLEFANCLCVLDQSTWEIRIPLASLNIERNRPFGIEIQIDEDNDGGSRDAKYGWAHPSRIDEDTDLTWRIPSVMGTGILE